MGGGGAGTDGGGEAGGTGAGARAAIGGAGCGPGVDGFGGLLHGDPDAGGAAAGKGGATTPQPGAIGARGSGNGAPYPATGPWAGAAKTAPPYGTGIDAIPIGRPALAFPTTYVPAARSPMRRWKRVEYTAINPTRTMTPSTMRNSQRTIVRPKPAL